MQRHDRLKEHLLSLRDILDLQSELLLWLKNCEAALTELEAHALPDDMEVIEALIKEHQVKYIIIYCKNYLKLKFPGVLLILLTKINLDSRRKKK